MQATANAINRTDGRCLDIVENQGPLTAGRLAELSGLTSAAVTAVLDRMERAGYARRVRDGERAATRSAPKSAKRCGG